MIFAKEFERLIRRWFAFVNKGIDPSPACRHAAFDCAADRDGLNGLRRHSS